MPLPAEKTRILMKAPLRVSDDDSAVIFGKVQRGIPPSAIQVVPAKPSKWRP